MLIPLLVCSLAAIVPAAEIPLDAVWHAPQTIEIPIGEQPESASLDLPAIPARENAALCLRFAVRLHSEEPAGWNQYFALEANGVPVGPLTQAGEWRVLNWPRFVRAAYRGETKVPVVQTRSNLDCLLVFFSPDASQADPRVLDNREQGCWYLVDISDALRPERPNTLKLTNTALRSYWPDGPPRACRMVIEH
ncbi:MAG: hypothetical protein JSV65_09000, partial [Armatimonadota bacterium]